MCIIGFMCIIRMCDFGVTPNRIILLAMFRDSVASRGRQWEQMTLIVPSHSHWEASGYHLRYLNRVPIHQRYLFPHQSDLRFDSERNKKYSSFNQNCDVWDTTGQKTSTLKISQYISSTLKGIYLAQEVWSKGFKLRYFLYSFFSIFRWIVL